jgi:hypothetical protein
VVLPVQAGEPLHTPTGPNVPSKDVVLCTDKSDVEPDRTAFHSPLFRVVRLSCERLSEYLARSLGVFFLSALVLVLVGAE